MPTSKPSAPEPSVRILGDPPAAARPCGDLTPADVTAQLSSPDLPQLLTRLGITGIDQEELLALTPRALAQPELLAAITEVANLLRAASGLDAREADLGALRERLDALQQPLAPGSGLLAILGHVAGTDVVRAWHAARGMSSEQSWAALADLGQQMRVHRLTYGALGHHTVFWTALAWAGRLFTLGRLQYDLHRETPPDGSEAPGRWVIGVHIPATSPLTPDSVEESFAQATAFFTEHFGDLQTPRGPQDPPFGHELTCSSWLLAPELADILGAESNLARFAARWSIEGRENGTDDAAFFVFHARPPYDAGAFPADTRLRRALRDRLVSGEGWQGGRGRIIR